VTLQFVRGGAVVAHVVTGEDGGYRIRLRAGGYTVRTSPVPRIGRGIEPATVRVAAGTWSRRDFSIDTGIR
jgi:hypothetical protein